MISFTWDPVKDLTNQRKHGVSFEEAKTVFADENALIEYDEAHSEWEERFRILGRSSGGKVLLVVYCVRDESVIRIISSRPATRYEQSGYERWKHI